MAFLFLPQTSSSLSAPGGMCDMLTVHGTAACPQTSTNTAILPDVQDFGKIWDAAQCSPLLPGWPLPPRAVQFIITAL